MLAADELDSRLAQHEPMTRSQWMKAPRIEKGEGEREEESGVRSQGAAPGWEGRSSWVWPAGKWHAV